MRAHVILVLRAMAAAPLAGIAVALNGLSLGANHLARMILGRVTHVPLADYQALAERFDKLSAECERVVLSAKTDKVKKGVPLADYQALAERFDKLSAECERHIVQASVKADK